MLCPSVHGRKGPILAARTCSKSSERTTVKWVADLPLGP